MFIIILGDLGISKPKRYLEMYFLRNGVSEKNLCEKAHSVT